MVFLINSDATADRAQDHLRLDVDIDKELLVKHTFLEPVPDHLSDATITSDRKASSDPTSSRPSSASRSSRDGPRHAPATLTANVQGRQDEITTNLLTWKELLSAEKTSLVEKARDSSDNELQQSDQKVYNAFDDYAGPLKPNGWSKGSELHGTGMCRPCRFMVLGRSCRANAYCRFCHIPHDSTQSQQRPSKTRRARCKKRVGEIDSNMEAGDLHAVADRLASQGMEMHGYVPASIFKR